MKKRIFLVTVITVLVCVISLGVLAGCSNTQEKIFDNDEMIISKDNSFYKKNSTSNIESGIYTNITKEFTGLITIKKITLPENASLNIELEIIAGQFKIVIVKDKKVYMITDKSINEDIAIDLPSGECYLKIVGKKANFNLKVDLNGLI